VSKKTEGEEINILGYLRCGLC